MIRFIFVILIILFVNKNCFSQKIPDQLIKRELELKLLYDSLFANDSIKYYQPDSIKHSINDNIIDIFDEILDYPASFSFQFEKLNKLGIRYSSDKSVKIYTWNIKFSNGHFKYYGYLQYKQKKQVNTYFLHDKINLNDSILNITIRDTNWYGALYYNILTNKYAGKKYYTLFGWDGNDYYTTKKVIDVLYFTKSGKPKFGKTIFKIEKQRSKRLIFEYSEKSVMSLSYDEKLKMIIYDFLAPSNPRLKNQYSFYGPDGTYDGLFFINGKWKHYPDIDIKKLKNSSYTSGKPKKGTYHPKRIYK